MKPKQEDPKEMVGGCCVCSDENGWTENPLVYCDGQGCNVAVHQGSPPEAPLGVCALPRGVGGPGCVARRGRGAALWSGFFFLFF